uniref:Thioredoxin domain-containing protein n=1 Tax=Eucampia antarctica TaxID=49252 RepID=A0A7S2R2Z8_9STRA|mmetsp:Transcript_15190/g.14654  ORF Transcript_15190/g.14654 Transcript_15190/m.14654 type:complete len:221 (+) Transcript_15190:295-957(+)
MKGNAKIAYWDTGQSGATPPVLGEIKGTPTIRLYNPKKKQGNSNKKKTVLDYNNERKAKDMKKFLEGNMPSFVEVVNGKQGLASFTAKAERNGLPQVLLFTSKPKTLAMTKFFSAEFRRRLLIAEIQPTKPNKDIMDLYGVKELPALIIIPAAVDSQTADPIRFEGDGFSKNKLQMLLSTHALKDPVLPKKKEEVKDTEEKKEEVKDTEEQSSERVKVEL